MSPSDRQRLFAEHALADWGNRSLVSLCPNSISQGCLFQTKSIDPAIPDLKLKANQDITFPVRGTTFLC
jgi:hypothetical protein